MVGKPQRVRHPLQKTRSVSKLVIDVGGTRLRSELLRGDETIREECPSQSIGLLAYIERRINRYGDIDSVAVSYAGQVDNGVIISAPNINIDEYKIADTVRSRYGIPLAIDNDLNCAVRAEALYWNTQSIAALFVGTGIGAALIDQGRVVRGSRNIAFEIGHIPYKEAPFRCGCGRDNCLELYASGSGLGKWMEHCGLVGDPDLLALKESGNATSRRIAEAFEEALLHAAGVLITLANPEIIVLGGGVIGHNRYLDTLLREKLPSYALKNSLESLKIERSLLENAPLEGAKLLEIPHG